MKDYSKIVKNEYRKDYYNENDQLYRLIGPAIEWWDGSKSYFINNIYYMFYDKKNNELFILPYILELNSEYEKYIKQNIKDLIQEFNPKIELNDFFYTQKIKLNKNYLKRLPNWLKNLIIL